jgi:hypothetical protein
MIFAGKVIIETARAAKCYFSHFDPPYLNASNLGYETPGGVLAFLDIN